MDRVVENTATLQTVYAKPLFNEIWERGRGNIIQFGLDWLDVDCRDHKGQVKWFHDNFWADERILATGNRWGKAGRNGDNNVLCNGYWKSFNELSVGEVVFSQDGLPCRVTGVYPQGSIHTYRLTFDDGASVVCSDEHLWRVKDHRRRFHKESPVYGTWTVMTTQEILSRWGEAPRPPYRVSIPVTEPVQFAHRDILLEPYALGLLLGNGSFTQRTVTYSTIDRETANSFSSIKPGRTIRNCTSYNAQGLNPTLRILGLQGCRAWDKFIPEDYLWNDVESRLAILQGLMDTDGDIEEIGRCNYSSASKKLSEQVLFLVQSLGGKGAIEERRTSYTYKGETKPGRVSYRVRFWLPGLCPFRIKRKAERWKQKHYTKERILVKIEDAGTAECTCISVDNPSGLFLLRDFIVTHNSKAASIKLAHNAFYQIRPEKYSELFTNYKAINLSMTIDMSRIAWQNAFNASMASSLMRKFIMENECKRYPFPLMVLGSNQKGNAWRSELWARSSSKDAQYLLSQDFDYVNWDEASREPHGPRILDDVLRMRLVDREGRLDMTSTGDGKNWFYELFLKYKQDASGHYYAQTGTSYENPHISHKRLKANEQRMGKEWVLQNIMGGFAGSTSTFNREAVKMCYAGNDWHIWEHFSEIKRDQSKVYFGGIDFARLRDSTVIIVAEWDREHLDTAGHIVYAQEIGREYKWEDIFDAVSRISMALGKPGFCIDSTGMAGDIIFETLTNERYGVNAIPVQFTQREKQNLIIVAQRYVQQHLITWPYIPPLYDQLCAYDYDDKELQTDWVFAYALLAECHRRTVEVSTPLPMSAEAMMVQSTRRNITDEGSYIVGVLPGFPVEISSDGTRKYSDALVS